MEIKVFERIERSFLKKIRSAILKDENDNIVNLQPFDYQPIELTYDEEGIEHCSAVGEICSVVRFTVKKQGTYSLEIKFADEDYIQEELVADKTSGNGYVEVSKKDKRYFTYSDGTSFYPIGINLAFPRSCIVSNNQEFGISNKVSYMGLRQYERWFKKCSEAGVNVARIWLGIDYFSPDTEDAETFDLTQFTKIDMLLDLAKKYGIKLKLTIEQFRYFIYDKEESSNVFRNFNKNLYLDGKACSDSVEWLTDGKWKKAWLNKIEEFAKRYSGDTEIFAIELWNEMNNVGHGEMHPWNKEMLPKVKELFGDNMVVNSLGSLDSEYVLNLYNDFCWELCDFKQIHRYLDQGAKYVDSTVNPIEVIQAGVNLIKDNSKPLFVAETGAVNNCHSGEFKYYSCDDRGIIFVDCVYTPVFCGCAGCGNIWHWDERYVESKNLYKYFKPLAEMVKEIDFQNEEFETVDFSDEDVYLFVLSGKKTSLAFVRNKNDNWKTVLRDLQIPNVVEKKIINVNCKNLTVYPIWDEDTTSVQIVNEKIEINNIKYGTIFKFD